VTGKIPGPKAAALVPANLRSKDFSERLRCVNQTMAGEMGKNSWWICLVLLFIPEWNDFLPSKTMDTKNTFAGWWGVFTLLSILVVTLVILQALCFLQVWLVRSRRLASDFLFPIGRQEYWRMMRWAVLKDFRLPFLFSFILMAAATLKTPNDAWHWAQRLPQFVLLAGQLLACCGVIVIFAAQRRTLQPIVYIFLAVIGLAIAGMIMDFSLRHPVFWYFNAALAALGFGLWMALPKVMQNFELPAQTR
jgi:hypothetical protein